MTGAGVHLISMKTFAAALLIVAVLAAGASAQARHTAKTKSAEPKAEQGIDFGADPAVKLLFQNDKTGVYLLSLPPHGESAVHRHPHDYLMVALDAIHARAVWGKTAARRQDMSPGQMDIIKVPVVHQVINEADAPYRMLIIEINDGFHPENIVCGLGKRSCPADTGDLQDTSQQYSASGLFDTDTVRVDEFTIGPGATLPDRTEKYPALRIALNDISLSDAVGGKTQSIHQAPGEVQWVPAEGTHTLTNPSPQEAHFYWIEFK